MADEKTIMIKPLKDITYKNVSHKKGSEAFAIPAEIGKRLIARKEAEEVK